MTNIQAIDLLKDLEQCLDDYCELNDEGKTAFHMAITALELFGNSEHLPSAQPYTAEEIQKMQELESAQVEKAYELGRKSAQPERKWIPCSERLPRQGQEVICQCRANMIKVLKLNAYGDWYQDAEHCYMSGFVIAWMPLPEPYRGGGADG